jgi:hypothetical protein
MTKKEGKAFLCDCLQKCGCVADIDELIVYTYGTADKADTYRSDTIVGNIDFSKVPTTVRYVVKCFIHMGIYVAWPQEVCRGSGKCIAYKKDLAAMEDGPNCNYKETTLHGDIKIYWFRGEAGAEKFITEKLLKD